jgi:hypothetical protein
VTLKSTIIWHVKPYNPIEVNRRFGGTHCRHLQGRRVSRTSCARTSANFSKATRREMMYTPKVQRECSSETLVIIYQTTLNNITVILKMEAVHSENLTLYHTTGRQLPLHWKWRQWYLCSSPMLVIVYQTTRYQILEDWSSQLPLWEPQISYIHED